MLSSRNNDLEMLNVSMKPMDGPEQVGSTHDTPVFSSLFHA